MLRLHEAEVIFANGALQRGARGQERMAITEYKVLEKF